MIISERVFIYGYRSEFNVAISFLRVPNRVYCIKDCDIIIIYAWTINSILLDDFKNVIKSGKKIIIDFTYEIIDSSVLIKLLNCEMALTNVEYYCNERADNYIKRELISDCLEKGLKLVISQFFIDNQNAFCPVAESIEVIPKRFVMYTGKTRPERTLITALLSYNDLLDHGYVSYFGDTHLPYDNRYKINDVFKLLDVYDNLALCENITDGLEKLSIPISIDVDTLSYDIAHNKNFTANYYQAVDFAVVLETEYDGNFFVTEKTIKCILLDKKFIVFSCVDFVKKLKEYYLNNMGKDISHLTDWCDIAYDDEQNKVRRAELIVQEIKKQIITNPEIYHAKD